jgi:hypothetical protein
VTNPINETGRKLTLAYYVRRRNGVPLGAAGSLRNMLHRSLGAGTFAEFWRYWNPIFGYYLGRYVNAPLKHWLPPALSLVITFVVCGALHDAVGSAVRGSAVFLFTPWFFFMGLAVVIGQATGLNYAGFDWPVRALINISYVGSCLLLAFAINSIILY